MQQAEIIDTPKGEVIEDTSAQDTILNKWKADLELLGKEVITFDEFIKNEVREVPFLWGNIIPQYCITFLTGPSDCNKSTFLRQLAFAVGHGEASFLGLPLKTEHKSVIMVITEDSQINMNALIDKQLKGVEREGLHVDIRFVFPASNVNEKLEALLSEKPADLVIIDTWTDTFNKDLNQANDVRASLGKLNDLIKKFGCSILCLHHIKKGADTIAPSKDGMIGSMGIQAFARTVFEMRRDPNNSDNRLLTVVKGNYTSDEIKNTSMILKLDEETMKLSNTHTYANSIGGRLKGEGRSFAPEKKEMFLTRVRELQADGISLDEAAKTLKTEYPEMHTPSKGTIHNWLKEDQGTTEPEGVVSQEEALEG